MSACWLAAGCCWLLLVGQTWATRQCLSLLSCPVLSFGRTKIRVGHGTHSHAAASTLLLLLLLLQHTARLLCETPISRSLAVPQLGSLPLTAFPPHHTKDNPTQRITSASLHGWLPTLPSPFIVVHSLFFASSFTNPHLQNIILYKTH